MNQLHGDDGGQSLKLLVKGFSGFDMRLLNGVVLLSKQRTPSIDLVDGSALSEVDVIMVDGKDEPALVWAQEQQSWLAKQAVVWVDAQHPVPAGHTALKRPIQWTNLPVILSRAIDDAVYQQASGGGVQPAGPGVPGVPGVAQGQRQAPQASQAPLPQSAAQAPGGGASRGPAILVVDDSAAVRGHLEFALRAVGYDVTSVDSGEAAIMEVGQRPYSCVLMDVLMHGIDGYETCRKIKSMAKTKGISPAVVMLTGKSSPFDKIRGKMAGCDAYLTKPVQKSHLMQVLAKYSFVG